jgi:hypothetical protein
MRIPVGCLIAALAMLFVACGGEQEIISQEEVALQAEALAPSAEEDKVTSQAGTLETCVPPGLPPPAPTPVKGEPLVNRDSGLSDAERMGLYERLRAEGDAQYRAWLECIDIGSLDLRSLPRGEMPVLSQPGERNLEQAVMKADLIIVGVVSELQQTAFSGMDTTINVDQAIKGSVASTVVITQSGRIQPTGDWTGVEIVEAVNGAMLLPGDRAVLFLQNTDPAGEALGEWYIQSFTGWYQVVDGKTRPNAFTGWGASVEGKTESEFVALVRSVVQ